VAKKKREYKVGQTILVKLSGQIAEATIRAVIERTDGLHLQVDFGYDQTALIEEWQVVQE
jgi:hypothetical protein